nr:hypothetical protein CFP56_47852 [Quercus suber]
MNLYVIPPTPPSIFSTDIAVVRRIAKQVSGRGGGLPSVQAMALAHGEDVTEVACNLLEPSKVGGDRVQQEVERLAREENIAVGKGYFTDLSQEEIVDRYLKHSLCPTKENGFWTQVSLGYTLVNIIEIHLHSSSLGDRRLVEFLFSGCTGDTTDNKLT